MSSHTLVRYARQALIWGAAIGALQFIWPTPPGVIVQGVVVGSLTALLAFGLSLVYKTNGIINFAQADLGVVPATLGLSLLRDWDWPYFVVLPITIVVAMALGSAVEFLVVPPVLEGAADHPQRRHDRARPAAARHRLLHTDAVQRRGRIGAPSLPEIQPSNRLHLRDRPNRLHRQRPAGHDHRPPGDHRPHGLPQPHRLGHRGESQRPKPRPCVAGGHRRAGNPETWCGSSPRCWQPWPWCCGRACSDSPSDPPLDPPSSFARSRWR